MPNTKSAERRMRNSEKKHVRNHALKSKLKTLEKRYLGFVQAGKKDEAAASLREVTSAFDRAAKGGVIHSRTADRKKSRLTARLATVK